MWLALIALAAAGFWVWSTRGWPPVGNVLHLERAAGIDPRLLLFLSWWDANGPFEILVAPNGGLRTDEKVQQAAYAAGNSKAPTLAQTPHGRGGAVDLWPCSFDPTRAVTAETYGRFLEIGTRAAQAGLRWGGKWTSAFPPGPANPYGGDLPHVEVSDWQSLPYLPAEKLGYPQKGTA